MHVRDPSCGRSCDIEPTLEGVIILGVDRFKAPTADKLEDDTNLYDRALLAKPRAHADNIGMAERKEDLDLLQRLFWLAVAEKLEGAPFSSEGALVYGRKGTVDPRGNKGILPVSFYRNSRCTTASSFARNVTTHPEPRTLPFETFWVLVSMLR